jgi:L-threonate 2-dehydrogenase
MTAHPPAAAAAGPITVVGVGLMGGAMARRLLATGHRVQMVDTDPAALQKLKPFGAVALLNTTQAAIDSVAIIVSVVDAAQTADVLWGQGGLLHGRQASDPWPQGQPPLVLLCPTIAPVDTQAFAKRLAEHGVPMLDAPMSGGPERAAAGTMSLMVAGADAHVSRAAPLLHHLAQPVVRIGARVGDAARVKLLNNLLAGIHLVAAAELLAHGERLGLDMATLQQVVAASSGASWIGTDRMTRALAGDTMPRAQLSLLTKDTALAVQMLQSAGLRSALGTEAASVFVAACAAGRAQDDDSTLLDWHRSA